MIRRRVGLFFSEKSTLGGAGSAQLKAALLAIEMTNQKNALTLTPVLCDTNMMTRPENEIYRLLYESKVDILVGQFELDLLGKILPFLDKTRTILINTSISDNYIIHPNLFSFSCTFNQLIEPLISWSLAQLSNNYIFLYLSSNPYRMMSMQSKKWLKESGGHIIYEHELARKDKCKKNFIELIKKTCIDTRNSATLFSFLDKPNFIYLCSMLHTNKIRIPIIAPYISENEVNDIPEGFANDVFITSPYFQQIENCANKKLLDSLTQKSDDSDISSICRLTATAYDAIWLIHEAYKATLSKSGCKRSYEEFVVNLKNMTVNTTQGRVTVDPRSQHIWQWNRIAQKSLSKELKILWSSPGPIPPKFDHFDQNHIEPCAMLTAGQSNKDPFNTIIGQSKKIKESIKIAQIASKTSSNVFILGQTGTGKEIFARAMHQSSPRSSKPFIAINCAAIPKELLESELFGYEEGSFTGAKKGGRKGKFELAHEGTLFLDEIGEMPLDFQTRLLRVVEEKMLFKIGSSTPKHLDIRIIAATNKDIYKKDITLSLRADLYHRLSMFTIHLPPLTERREDIPILANHFLRGLNIQNQKTKTFDTDAILALKEYNWPGNVRELLNVVNRCFHLSLDRNIIKKKHLPLDINAFSSNLSSNDNNEIEDNLPSETQESEQIAHYDQEIKHAHSANTDSYNIDNFKLEKVEKSLVQDVLMKYRYNITKSAQILGMSRTTLYRKIKKYSLDA